MFSQAQVCSVLEVCSRPDSGVPLLPYCIPSWIYDSLEFKSNDCMVIFRPSLSIRTTDLESREPWKKVKRERERERERKGQIRE